MKFEMGGLYMTSGVSDLTHENLEFAKFVAESLARHALGDWGDLGEEDRQANEDALVSGDRLFSAYTQGEWKIWIVTESDRSATTIMNPSEY